MCKRLILDSDTSHFVLDPKTQRNRDHQLQDWISDGHGVLCYTTEGKLGSETIKTKSFMRKLEMWQARGRAFRVSTTKFSAAQESLEKYSFKSNDRDVVALAIAGEVHIVGTQDGRLKKDLEEIIPRATTKNILLYPVDKSDDKRTEFLDENRCEV